MNTRNISQAGPCARVLCPPLLALAAGAALMAAPSAFADIGYQFVTVGNPGNANDTATGSLYGGVSYTYDIGTYDVTLNQYATFLNAVAQTDTYALYNANMGTDANIVGISRSGSSGNYSYAVIGDGQHPVTYVSWFDAARMANWMQNGQPGGLGEVVASTEEGAYTLDGANLGVSISKNGNALYWIPSENEWYKAAYYDPTIAGPNKYWTYATRSNNAPGNNATNPTVANQANYRIGTVYSVTQTSSLGGVNALTDVGLFSNSASAYSTYDQSGDVNNWNDAVIGSSRGLRGGTWSSLNGASGLQSSLRLNATPQSEGSNIGFRLAVPEPGVAVSLIIAGGLLLSRRKRPSALLAPLPFAL